MKSLTQQSGTRIFLLGLLASLALVGCNTSIHVREPGSFNRIMDPGGIEPITAAYMAGSRYDPDMRSLGTRLLADTSFGGATPYLKLYRQLLKDKDATVRTTAIRALGRHGKLEDVPLLVKMLSDENDWVRQEAIIAIKRFNSPKSIEPLRESAVKDESMDVRIAACQALAQYPLNDTFQTLIAALDDDEYNVIMAAGIALSVMTGHDPKHKRVESGYWLDWLEKSDAPFKKVADESEEPADEDTQKTEIALAEYKWSEFPDLPHFGRRLGGAFFDANLSKHRRLNRPEWSYYDPIAPETAATFPTPYSMIVANQQPSYFGSLFNAIGKVVVQSIVEGVSEEGALESDDTSDDVSDDSDLIDLE